MGDQDGSPKIQVDSDWKEEARREKERLTAQEAKEGAAGSLPPATFLEIVNMLAMQAAVSVGGYQLQTGEIVPPDLPMAQHLIDLLDILAQKTKGNLTPEENRILSAVLHDLRLRYVDAVRSGAAPAEMA